MRALFSMLALAALSLLGSACGEKSESPKALAEKEKAISAGSSESQTPPVPASADAAGMRGKAHFVQVSAVKDTLLFADLANAQRMLSSVMTSSGAADEPDSWRPFTIRLREIASAPTNQEPVTDVARSAAKLAAQCGACHLAHAVEPRIALSAIDPSTEDFKNHMVGHKWALDRMWAGLATPSDTLWNQGAALIADKPTHLKNLSNYKSQGDLAIDYARRTHELAASALKAEGTEERVDVFARFLATCASCHGLEGSGIGAAGLRQQH